MTIKEAHYAFKINMDRVDSLTNPDFKVWEIDWLLNEAQNIFIKQRISALSNSKRKGVEASQKRIDDLSTLLVKYPVQPGLTPTLDSGVYELDLSNLSYTYLHYMSGYVLAQLDENCTKEIPLRFIQHDDYRVAMRDPFNSSSTEFVLFNMGISSTSSSPSIYMYPGDFDILTVYIEYLKKPARVNLGNYTYIDGTTLSTQDFELPEHTHSEIVDIACQIASLSIESPEYIQLKNQKVLINE